MSNAHNLGPADAPRQILGYDPVAPLAAVHALLTLLLSFGALKAIGLKGPDDLTLLLGVLNGLSALYLSCGTTETMLAALVELFKGLVSFGAIYGLDISSQETGLVVVAINDVFTAFLCTQTSPLARGSFATIPPDDVVIP